MNSLETKCIDFMISLVERVANLEIQLECMRQLQQISDDLREIRANASRAIRGERQANVGTDAAPLTPANDTHVYASIVEKLGFIDIRLDNISLSDLSEHFLDDIRSLQREIRKLAIASALSPLHQIARSTDHLRGRMGEISKLIHDQYRKRDEEARTGL